MSVTENGEDSHGSLVINNKKLLMWLFLGSDCMFFGTLISTHLIYRKLYPESYDPLQVFDLELTSFSTFILLMSSFLMALAVSALKYNYVSIQSPTSGKKAIDLSNHLIHTEYFEDLLSPVITMKMRIRSEFNCRRFLF